MRFYALQWDSRPVEVKAQVFHVVFFLNWTISKKLSFFQESVTFQEKSGDFKTVGRPVKKKKKKKAKPGELAGLPWGAIHLFHHTTLLTVANWYRSKKGKIIFKLKFCWGLMFLFFQQSEIQNILILFFYAINAKLHNFNTFSDRVQNLKEVRKYMYIVQHIFVTVALNSA